MLQFVYISTARAALDETMLNDILATSRRRNRVLGVSGLLLAGGRRFLQVLEGPEPAVSETFRRIGSDPRHFALVELGSKRIDGRQFGDWSMAFEAGGDASPEEGLAEAVERLVGPLSDRSLRAQLEGFAALHRRAA